MSAMADDPGLVAMTRQVIDANRYLVLATADHRGVPRTSPVWCAHMGYREFLWLSRPQAWHSGTIRRGGEDVRIPINPGALPSEPPG